MQVHSIEAKGITKNDELSIGIIIPTLNEAESINRLLSSLKKYQSQFVQIVIVDSGSHDSTVEIAKNFSTLTNLPATIIHSKHSGRAHALNQGARHLLQNFENIDCLWFLHADCLPPDDWYQQILMALSDAQVVGGAFEFGFINSWGKRSGARMRLIELLNRLRYRVSKRYFGDQGIFVRTHNFLQLGGYPEIQILEDAEFCRQLHKKGKLYLVKSIMPTDGRRFIEEGPLKQLIRDIRILSRYRIGLGLSSEARVYQKYNLDR